MQRLTSRKVAAALAVTCAVAVPALSGDNEKLPFKSADAFAYAEKWCGAGNDCPAGQYNDRNNTDCTHFISHVLKAGGVSVTGSEAKCDSGLCIRVRELAVWFSNGTAKYSNVKKLNGWRDAKRGDFCFLQATLFGLNLGQKYHVMLLAEASRANGAKVYGHENNRCGEFTEFDVDDCVYYRIEE
jgi:hypothetical protein